MTKKEIIEYLYENNVRGDLTIEQMAEDIADTPQTECDTCRHYKPACELSSEICKYEPTTQTETENSNLTFEKVMEEIQTQVIEFPDTHQKFTFARKIEMDGDSIKIGGWEYKGVKDAERLVKGSEQTESTISKMEQVEPQTCSFSDCDNFKNPDYERCIECKRKQIKLKTEQTETKTETQNSNLTFEKRTMRDCYNCKKYETEGECIECHYEPKDEPQTERSE